MELDNIEVLKEELNKKLLETESLKKAIWDILNYTNMFVLLLDREMNIKLINWNLATTLGFENEKEPLGRCWLDFINPDDHTEAKIIHSGLVRLLSDRRKNLRETIMDIVTNNQTIISVKWYNTVINSGFNMVFSFGVKRSSLNEETEESIRSYYRDIIEKDRTMITSMKDIVLKGDPNINICNIKVE